MLGPGSIAAAEAAQCAANQGKFWEYHDKISTTPAADPQHGWSPEQFAQLAAEVGLDPAAFGTCIESHSTFPALQSDLEEAVKLGIRSTPSFYLNGELFSGARPFEVFEDKIEAALKAKA